MGESGTLDYPREDKVALRPWANQLTSLGHGFLIYKMGEMMGDQRVGVSQLFTWEQSSPSTFCSSYTQSIVLSQVLFPTSCSYCLLQSGMFSKAPFRMLLLILQSPNHVIWCRFNPFFLSSPSCCRDHHIQHAVLDTLLDSHTS